MTVGGDGLRGHTSTRTRTTAGGQASGTPESGERSGDDRVLLLGIGDTHGDFSPLFEAAKREPEARAILQVGDLTAGKAGREQHPDDDPATLDALPLPLVWVHGNHEHWDVLGLWDEAPPQVTADARSPAQAGERSTDRHFLDHHLWPGSQYVVPETGVQIVGLPGNYAPTWYEREKPFPGDRVRHFNSMDVERLHRFEQPSVLLMHESFRGQAPGRIGTMGIPALAGLVRRLRPRVCLTGHHHSFAVTERGPTLALSLPRAQVGYVRLWFTRRGDRAGWEFVRQGAEEVERD